MTPSRPIDAENQLSPRVNGGVEADRHPHHPCRLCALFLAAAVRAGGQFQHRPVQQHHRRGHRQHQQHARAERADYYDLGAEQKLGDFTVGLDSFYKASKNLIDEGQFGAPIILTPFNYAQGRQYGGELTINYTHDGFTAYTNASYERAVGKNINSSQFQFDPGDLAYIADNYIPLDHQQLFSLSAGASYTWEKTHISADLLYGTGLRKDGATPNGDSVPDYVTVNFGIAQDFDIAGDERLHGAVRHPQCL